MMMWVSGLFSGLTIALVVFSLSKCSCSPLVAAVPMAVLALLLGLAGRKQTGWGDRWLATEARFSSINLVVSHSLSGNRLFTLTKDGGVFRFWNKITFELGPDMVHQDVPHSYPLNRLNNVRNKKTLGHKLQKKPETRAFAFYFLLLMVGL